MTDFNRIRDDLYAARGRTLAQYTVEVCQNSNRDTYLRLRFNSFDALETFFCENLIGSGLTAGFASKVIGTTLLIFDRNPTKD